MNPGSLQNLFQQRNIIRNKIAWKSGECIFFCSLFAAESDHPGEKIHATSASDRWVDFVN